MARTIEYTKQADTDLNGLDNSQKKQVLKAILRVSNNPQPNTKGGHGKPLGNNLTGFLKIKLKKHGIRVFYRIVFENEIMRVVIISIRAEEQVYKLLQERIKKGQILTL
ncbi:MAG: type II toxin-antitoxin system RelE/ParE family toxin [Chloroflexi bacterium]|nr:type II toxin-antitoxin system RelE/ParE family toxin [Chloroflexota bacterium]